MYCTPAKRKWEMENTKVVTIHAHKLNNENFLLNMSLFSSSKDFWNEFSDEFAFIEVTEYSKAQKSFTSFKVTSAQTLVAEEIPKIANPGLSFLPTLGNGRTEA